MYAMRPRMLIFMSFVATDTANATTEIDPSAAQTFWSKVPGAINTGLSSSGWIYPCSTPGSSFPTLALSFDDANGATAYVKRFTGPAVSGALATAHPNCESLFMSPWRILTLRNRLRGINPGSTRLGHIRSHWCKLLCG
jgi:hypothetical protein